MGFLSNTIALGSPCSQTISSMCKSTKDSSNAFALMAKKWVVLINLSMIDEWHTKIHFLILLLLPNNVENKKTTKENVDSKAKRRNTKRKRSPHKNRTCNDDYWSKTKENPTTESWNKGEGGWDDICKEACKREDGWMMKMLSKKDFK